jgi:ceramide glucosyltransferase
MWLICTALAIVGCAYALVAAGCVAAFGARAALERRREIPAAGSAAASVSILKPLFGAEPMLKENLASFAQQQYAGPCELLFGVAEGGDPAACVARALIAAPPAGMRRVGMRLVVAAATCGPNRKVGNLANLAAHATGEIIVAADSDIKVPSAYLSAVVAALARPGVGLVTCLYRGLPAGGLWSRLSAAAIDHHFLPSVLVAVRYQLAAPCFGSTVALRREVLQRIGGFAAFAHYLADDYAVAAAVRGLGYAVAMPDDVVDHTCSEASLRELFAHELRWARTLRGIAPWGYAGMVVAHPLPFALIGVLCAPSVLAVAVLCAVLSCRLALQLRADRVLGRSVLGAWWGPVRDLLSFAVYVAGYWPGEIEWRGRRHQLRRGGTLKE